MHTSRVLPASQARLSGLLGVERPIDHHSKVTAAGRSSEAKGTQRGGYVQVDGQETKDRTTSGSACKMLPREAAV